MEKKTVLEIEFQPVFDKWAWRITKQNEEILIRNEFIDEELNVESFRSPEFLSLKNKLFIRGSEKRLDDNISICNQEEKALIEDKVKAINKKYVVKKRWRAKWGENFYYINFHFEPERSIEFFLEEDDDIYKSGNYFETAEEVEEYAEYIKKCSLKWHEMRGRDE